MRISLISLLCLILIISCDTKDSSNTPALLITNIHIVDASQGLQKNMNVAITGNKISQIFPSNEHQEIKAKTTIDGQGKYLIPGLWDAHVHFAFIEDLAPDMFHLFLRYGITSVRDTGGKIDFVKKWKDKSIANPTTTPRVKIAGPLLDGLPNVYDGSAPSRPELSVGLADEEACRAAVRKLDSMGVDLVKAYEMLSPDQFVALTNEAQKLGLKVTGHIPLSMDVISASNAGLNSIEHLRNIEMSCTDNADELLQQRRTLLLNPDNEIGGVLRSNLHNAQRYSSIDNQDDTQTNKVLNVLAKNETWQIPTLTLCNAMSKKPFAQGQFRASFSHLPDSIAQLWNQGVHDIEAMDVSEQSQKFGDWALEMTQKMHNKDIPIMAGTDCPIFYLTPGYSLHEELYMLTLAGLSNQEALASATTRPAEYFNMQDSLGLIKEHMIADLILLEKNPLENIRNTTSIISVVKDGVIYVKD